MSDKPINLDADRESADWIKTLSWDLPTDPDMFIATVAPTPEALAAFMRLPAARAMPPELREELVRRGVLQVVREGRFGVSVGERYTYYWKVRTAAKRSDIYVSSQRTGSFLHISVHDAEYGLHVKVKTPDGPHLHKLPMPTPFAPGATRLVQLRIPTALVKDGRPSRRGVVWVEVPEDYDQWVAFDIIAIDPEVFEADDTPAWMEGRTLVGVLERAVGGAVAVVASPMRGGSGSLTMPADEATRQRIKDALAEGNELRMLLEGTLPDGAIWFLEMRTEAATPENEGAAT